MFACLLQVFLRAPPSRDPEVVTQHWTQQAGPQTELLGWEAVPLQLLPWSSSRAARPLLPVSPQSLWAAASPPLDRQGQKPER